MKDCLTSCSADRHGEDVQEQFSDVDQLPRDCLQRFMDTLQAWNATVAAGLRAITVLLGSFSVLDASSAPKETIKLYERLLELAPSFQLEQYIQQQQQPTVAASDAATQMHTAVGELKSALEDGQVHLSALQRICEQCQEAVLAVQLSDARLDALDPADPDDFHGMSGDVKSSLPLSQTSRCPAVVPYLAETPASSSSTPAIATYVQQKLTTAVTPAAVSGDVQSFAPEEVAVLMEAVVHGLQRNMHWMKLAQGSINLDISAEDLSTISTLWELQPFTNEDMTAALASALQSSGDQGS